MITNGKAEQVITFGAAPTNAAVGDPPLTVTASSSSPTAPPSSISITFTSLSPAICTTGGANGATVTLVAAGQCTIAADQAGDATYNPAPQVTQTFTVASAGAIAHFTPTGAMTVARSDHTATLLLDGRVLVAGGFDSAGAPLNSSELYCPDNAQAPPEFSICPTPARGTFGAIAAMPSIAAGHTATRLHDGSVLVIGGGSASLRAFTPSAGAWTTLTTSPLADRAFHTATLLSTGQVFVAGGVDALGATLKSTFIVDPSTDPPTVAQGPDLNFAREGHTATLLPDDTVLIAGGRAKQAVDFAVVGEYETYDPSGVGPFGNGDVVDEAAMSRSRFWHAAEIAGLRVVVTGGSCDPASAVSSSLAGTEFFSFATGAGAVVGCAGPAGASDLGQARRAFTLTPLTDGSLLAIGGADGASAQRSSSEVFKSGAEHVPAGPAADRRALGAPGDAAARWARARHRRCRHGRRLDRVGGDLRRTPDRRERAISHRLPTRAPTSRSRGRNGPVVERRVERSRRPRLAYFWTFTAKPAGSAAHFSNANTAVRHSSPMSKAFTSRS